MGDFPPQWQHVRDLEEGGQGHTFVVRRADGSDPREYVLKRLKNPNREDYFRNEIKAYRRLDHPHILKIIETGRTPRGKPYILTEYCPGLSLTEHPAFTSPSAGLRFFRHIVDAIDHAHSQPHPIYHLDLKPPNILLRNENPVVGDFGVCFIDDGEVSITKEGHRGSLYYCAPELRNPKITDTTRLSAADIYSLGKLLFWLFTHEVYDGHEDDYGGRRLFQFHPKEPHFVFIDDLIAEMVVKDPAKRIQSAVLLTSKLTPMIERIEANGRVLDLSIPQRCLYCAVGHYQPGLTKMQPHMGGTRSKYPDYPNRELRRNPPTEPSASTDGIYEKLRYVAGLMFGSRGMLGRPAPMFLICDHCGNVQYFRFDCTVDGKGLNWLP